MPAILLTSDNLDSLKAALRRELQMLKSAHLTEALAQGAGFRTHAALLTAIKSAPTAKPIFVDMDLPRITARLTELGNQKMSVEFLADVIRSPDIPDRPWITFQKGDLRLNNYWFYECRRRGIPMVFIETRRKYVRLNWDCITIDPDEEGHVRDHRGNDLGHDMFKTFQTMARSVPGKAFFDASSFDGHIDHLSPELAYKIADVFFGMLYRPMTAQAQAA